MPPIKRQYQIFVDRPPDAVWTFQTTLKNLPRITSEAQKEEVTGEPIELESGARFQLRSKRSGGWATQELEIFDWNPPHSFAERQVGDGPWASWLHRRKFTPFQAGTLMHDHIEYLPAGPLGALADKMWLGKYLDELFNYRQKEAKRLLEQVGRIKGR